MAWSAGVRGFVCSPAEVTALRAELGPEATLVTPGVRPAGSAAHRFHEPFAFRSDDQDHRAREIDLGEIDIALRIETDGGRALGGEVLQRAR